VLEREPILASQLRQLFWIFTLLPIRPSGEIATSWPMLHPAPMREFFITCETRQILLPGPIMRGSST
jgi:hypothetical protein